MALIDTQDVERLFRGLVQVLAERDPARLTGTFQVAELYQQLVPYRAYRTLLGFDSNLDYEAAVLGLLAGVGGYATLEPAEAQASLAAEAASAHPDSASFRDFAGARVRLDPAHVRAVLGAATSYAPEPEPEPVAVPEPAKPDLAGPAFRLESPATAPPSPTPAPSPPPQAGTCAHCGRDLPTDRTVVFCPFCGRPVGTLTCVRCGDDLDTEWRFCPRCGATVRR